MAELKAQVAGLLAQVKGRYVMKNEDPGAGDLEDQMVLLDMAVTTAKSSAAASREGAQRAREEEAKWKARAGVWEERCETARAELAQMKIGLAELGQVETQTREAEVAKAREETRVEGDREMAQARGRVRSAEAKAEQAEARAAAAEAKEKANEGRGGEETKKQRGKHRQGCGKSGARRPEQNWRR